MFTAAMSAMPLGISGVAAAYSTNPEDEYNKVYVCKFVTKPGRGEILQSGQNPISVDTSAITGFQGIGSSFNDQHGRSYVVAWDTGDKVKPPVSLCTNDEEYIVVEIPATPAVNDPCGPGNATWVVPEDTDSVMWELGEDGALTAYTAEGVVFTDETTEHVYGTAVDNSIACPVTPPNGGNVLGEQTTAPARTLEETGISTATLSVLSGVILCLAILTATQNTPLGDRFAARIRAVAQQPFVVPTV